jgi:hypothetical protein
VSRRAALAAAASIVLFGACQQTQQAQRDITKLRTVQAAVQRSVGPYGVGVYVRDGGLLMITVVNSPLHELPIEAKVARARELAELALKSYADRAAVLRVVLVFQVTRTQFVFFHSIDGRDRHEFDVAALHSVAATAPH